MRCFPLDTSGDDAERTAGPHLRRLHRTTGYPSPAQDYAEARLDIRDLLIAHPAATFFVVMESETPREEGIRAGDILVVDRALDPRPGGLVVAVEDGELVVRRVRRAPASTACAAPDAGEWALWGVVTWVLHLC